MANFPDLPREIRDMIWLLVLRDNHPGVHIFGHYDENKKGMAEGRSLMHGDLFNGIISESSPDKYFASLDKNCVNEDVSTYLTDGAMWNTCKESRLAIEKHFSPYKRSAEEWWRCEKRDSRGWDESPVNCVFKMPSSAGKGYFEGGCPHYLTIFPRKDLFVFQPDKVDGMDWSSFAWHLTKGDTRPAFQRPRHIAVEYDAEWWVSHDGCARVVAQLQEAVFALKDIEKLWFIDHNLKRKKNAPAFKEGWDHWESTNAFYARDRKFLEIDWRKSGALEDWEYVKPVGGDSSDKFVDSSIRLARQLNDFIRCSQSFPGYPEYGVRSPTDYCQIGLLGWDEL